MPAPVVTVSVSATADEVPALNVATKVVVATNALVPYLLFVMHCVEMSYDWPARFESARVITKSVSELPRLALARVKVFPATNLLVPTAVTVTEAIELPAFTTTVSVHPVQPEEGATFVYVFAEIVPGVVVNSEEEMACAKRGLVKGKTPRSNLILIFLPATSAFVATNFTVSLVGLNVSRFSTT
jgi:hypothetical protein